MLLFQNCLYPLTVFAEEAPPEVDTEFVQDLQNQGEQPVTQETGLPETATNDSTVEVEENIEEIVDEAPVVDEVPIVEEQEVKEIPTEIPNEPSTEVTEPVIPFEDPVPPILRQSAGLRKNLPNLDEYRPYLVAYGKKHYIDETLTNAIGREITLAATVGSKNSFTVSVPTFQKVMQENDHGWISWIASNLSTADDYPYDTMYYGNTAAGGTYELTIPSDQSVNGYQVTITKPSITLFTATFDVTITRLALSSVREEKLTLNGNVKLGTVAIASQFPQLPRVPIEDVSYDNALLGTITIKNEQPDPAIKSEVTVEAQREKDLSEDVLKSWFSILPEEPEDSGDYDYSLSSGPTEWAPDTTGTATVSVTNKETNDTREFTTRYTVVDTTPPEGKLKDSLVYEQGSETPDLRELLDGDPTDNWSKSKDIRLELIVDNGLQFSELPVGDHGFTLTLTDEFNNEIKLKGTFVITPNKQYIDVTIPTRMSFIQETALASIISPNYQIQNNSIRPVEVYVDSMTSLEQTERLTELTLGIQHIDRDQEVLLVSKGQNLSESVELVTLTSEQNTYEFSLFGAAGDNIQSEILDAPIRPSYLMGLHFKIQ